MKRALLVLGSLVLLLTVAIWGCVEPRLVTEETAAEAAEGPGAAPAKVTATPPYDKEIPPLKTEECAQCHTYYYNIIREAGGKHQIDCTECHTRFHVYHPGKVKYEDILPECKTCHGLAHGEKLAKCLECHINAHTPTKNMAGAEMDAGCSTCHDDIVNELKTHKSKHTDVVCSDCHIVHRHIPVCADCHEPHIPTQTNADCLSCHPVHEPLEITYPQDTPQETCAVCHPKPMKDLQKSQTKHTALSCALCHPKHREILQCTECHGQPHSAALLKGFKKCGDCHGIAHNLPK